MTVLKPLANLLFTLILISFSDISIADVYQGKLIEPSNNNAAAQVQKNKSEAVSLKRININKAGLDELRRLPYVGAKRADAIIKYRQKNGPFKSIDDVAKVRNISSAIASKLEDNITFR